MDQISLMKSKIKYDYWKILVEILDGMSQDTISYVLNGIRNIC